MFRHVSAAFSAALLTEGRAPRYFAITPNIRDVWNSTSANVWEQGLRDYWTYIKPSLLALEREIQQLNPESVRAMDAQQWYAFLLEKYFRWKYTAPNRYASSTKSLKEYNTPMMLPLLHKTKDRLFTADKQDIKQWVSFRLADESTLKWQGTSPVWALSVNLTRRGTTSLD